MRCINAMTNQPGKNYMIAAFWAVPRMERIATSARLVSLSVRKTQLLRSAIKIINTMKPTVATSVVPTQISVAFRAWLSFHTVHLAIANAKMELNIYATHPRTGAKFALANLLNAMLMEHYAVKQMKLLSTTLLVPQKTICIAKMITFITAQKQTDNCGG